MEGNLGVFPDVGLQKERQQRGHHRGDDPQVEIARHRTFCLVNQVLYPHRFSDGGRGLGDDLYVDVEVDLYSAVLGGEKVVDTLDGKVKLKIKPETQNGTKVRLKGKGFPVYKKEGQFGDLIVTYSVKIPTNLTDKQKELFRQLQSMN